MNGQNKEFDVITNELISTKLLRHTIQIFKKTDKGLRPFGTGVLLQTHNKYFILTCSHVAEHIESSKDESLYVRVGKKEYVNIIGEFKLTDIDKSGNIDLAYIVLGEEIVPILKKPYLFLDITKIRDHKKLVPGSNYCVIGYSEKNISFESGKMETGASVYITTASNEKPYEHYKMSNEDFIILDMKGKGTDIKNGNRTKVNTHFYGISGCGLWLLEYFENLKDKTVDIDYRLIGIMTEFKKGKYFCLIGNKIHLIIKALEIIEGLKFNRK